MKTGRGAVALASMSATDIEDRVVESNSPPAVAMTGDFESSASSRISHNDSSPQSHRPISMPSGHEISVPLNRLEQSDEQATTAAMSNVTIGEPAKSVTRIERENFLLFIKILFKVLEEDDDPPAHIRAKRIVMECRRRNQRGEPEFQPLIGAVERHLRGFVGESKWRRSHILLHHLLVNRGGCLPSAAATCTAPRPNAVLVRK